ncbi:type IV pilin protein [Alkalimonas collagenimarina]|uniref:Type IV pilin protein n=1 Tax=Alkalimonas collagenimarina TaxID=400390 RepID=A0ABT9H0M1_9GAMM|nr:type IV pilin protein [Alkalimonas collagenimarina]MDP4536852.1 type IV pilin protein [Alkalimonas collagenimarina]
MKKNRLQHGMTLIEIMVVVAIVGIIAAIAYPAYQSQIERSYRTSATGCLFEMSHVMERYYTSEMSYVGATLPTMQCQNDTAQRYSYSITNQAARTYTLTAVPQGVQATDDCGTLTLTQAGQKGAAGGTDPAIVQKCW